MAVKKTQKRNNRTLIRSQVKALLTSGPAFRSLPPDKRKQVAHDTVRVANSLVLSDRRPSADKTVANVDFPDFVANLISGVFGAIVDGSIKQMEAYAKLVAGVAKSLDEFMSPNISDKEARDHLLDRFPYFFRSGGRTNRLRVTLASSRQKLLASLILMGINRIVVTEGRISPEKN